MSRIGKIARLPKAVRDELNWRLLDGEEGKSLVEWLNGHLEVQAVLKAQYDGRAINEPNLTAWRQGGFLDWQQQQESLEVAGRLVEESAALGALTQGRLLSDRAADIAALAIAEQLMAARRMEEGEEKRRAILKLVRGLVRLRKTDRECEKARREAEREERLRKEAEEWAKREREAAETARRMPDGRPWWPPGPDELDPKELEAFEREDMEREPDGGAHGTHGGHGKGGAACAANDQ